MAELSTRSMINDERWAFVDPLLPQRRHRPRLNGRMDTRRAFAAVVYAVTTDTPWDQVPNAFGGVRPSTVQRRFWSWTDADVWRQLASAATGTPHEKWAHTVANAAIRRAGQRAHGYPHPEPDTESPAELPTKSAATPPAAQPRRRRPQAASRRTPPKPKPPPAPPDNNAVVAEPPPRRYPRYSPDEYAIARDAINRHHGL